MCGRFVSARKRLELLEEFAATRDVVAADRQPDYNVAPTKRIYTVLEHKDERELRLVRWGLVPSWAKDTKGGARMINARSETVAVKPSFRAAFAKRRCLIPADGYYEWITEDKAKKPYYIYRTDGGILAFAGIYELWRNSQVPDDHEDAWYWSASIITTQADGRDRPDPRPDADGDRAGRLGGLAQPGQPRQRADARGHAPRDLFRGGRPVVPPGLDGRQLRAEQRPVPDRAPR